MSESSETPCGIPQPSPVQPVELEASSNFRFRCHKDVACFNACCRDIDITLTPYDIIRLKRRLGMSSREFVGEYTVPFPMDAHGLPGLKLSTKPGCTECVFLGDRGCAIYEDRPASCRYYALGNMGVRRKDCATIDEIYFVVKEPHCLGHLEEQVQTVDEYRREQGVDVYDDMNRGWREIVLKKRSSGPTVGKPSERSLQLFDMCSYDMDGFREFVRSRGFRQIFDLDDERIREMCSDDDSLLAFSMRFLKQVLFGESSIPLKDNARAERIAAREAVWRERRRKENARHRRARMDELGD